VRPAWMHAGRVVRRCRRVVRRWTARIPDAPVFVLGNQKSGTSAIASLLGLATGLDARIDLPRANRRRMYPAITRGELGFDRFIRLNRESFAHGIVKEPNLTPLLEPLLARFPRSPVVFVVRDPRANLRSILQRLGLPCDIEDLSDERIVATPGSWPLVLDGRWLGIDGETVIDQLAGRWMLLLETFRRHRDRVVLLRYEDFMIDRREATEALAGRLGLPVRHDVSAEVDRAFQPRGDASVSWRTFFGDRNLTRINDRCRAGMVELGYDPFREDRP
jgi:hypothetical protein